MWVFFGGGNKAQANNCKKNRKIRKWNIKKLDNPCFKILQSSFAPLCQYTMKQPLWLHRMFNLLIGSACGAELGRVLVGCKQEAMSSWLCQVRIPKNWIWCLFFAFILVWCWTSNQAIVSVACILCFTLEVSDLKLTSERSTGGSHW